ncbi:MAG: protein YgfX [Propionivibrio sp.]
MRFPVAIELRRSLCLSVLVVSVHVLAATGLLGLPWSSSLRAPILLALGLSAAHFLLRPHALGGLLIASKTELRGRSADGQTLPLQVLPDSTVFNQLIVLRLRVGDEEKIRSLVLLPDQMTGEQFRILRLWLRWQVAIDDASSAS